MKYITYCVNYWVRSVLSLDYDYLTLLDNKVRKKEKQCMQTYFFKYSSCSNWLSLQFEPKVTGILFLPLFKYVWVTKLTKRCIRGTATMAVMGFLKNFGKKSLCIIAIQLHFFDACPKFFNTLSFFFIPWCDLFVQSHFRE
jgi:hypothetical protein